MQEQHETTYELGELELELGEVELGEIERLQERQEAGEALSFREARVLREAGIKVEENFGAFAKAFRDPRRQHAYATWKAMRRPIRERYADVTLAQTRRDPYFRMCERKMDTRSHMQVLRARRGVSAQRRPRARRASSSSTTSGTDPGDPGLPEALVVPRPASERVSLCSGVTA